jgi:hypothetical protein
VHDRRIDGETEIFGNAGALFMSAMTWYDHTTASIWSQPWGRAIKGSLKGVELFLLPSRITTWGTWKGEHPETLAMINDVDRLGNRRQGFDENFVIGLLLGDAAGAFYFRDVVEAGLINDWLGEFPILVWAEGDNFHVYLRKAGDRVLTFRDDVTDGLVDEETGSSWDITRGMAIAGPLKGEVLQPVPGSSAFDWAWRDFYPESEFYTPQ